MNKSPYDTSLIEIDRLLSTLPKKVVLTGKSLTVQEIIAVARGNAVVEFTKDQKILDRVQECYERMMTDVKNGVPIYGCNSGYGAQAAWVLTEGTSQERIDVARHISEGITHVDVSVGPRFEKDVVRASMLIRINMLLQGVSAVKLSDLDIYRQMLNAHITPIVNQYGGIGASGDLAHNCRVLNAARGMKGVAVWNKNGKEQEAESALQDAKIVPLKLDPKAGLGLVNGDNFSTALATLLSYDTLQLLLLSTVASSMTVEVLKGSNRSFHPLLAAVRPHTGQKEVAQVYRYLLTDSKLAYQEMSSHVLRPQGIKIQDGYSLRGISQFQGVNFEKIKQAFKTITINANSVSDNPLWVAPEYTTPGEEPWHWVSGGNFLAMYMVEVMDSLRKIMTQTVKLTDRHIARIVDTHENNGLPANLSDENALSHCAFKGVQIQSGMLEVYSSLLSIPVSTFFGVHEEGNQDITAHSLTSGILAIDNLRLARYAVAQNLLALAQAVDLRGAKKLLAPATQPVYSWIRKISSYVKVERPLNNEIEAIYADISSGKLNTLLREQVYSKYATQ